MEMTTIVQANIRDFLGAGTNADHAVPYDSTRLPLGFKDHLARAERNASRAYEVTIAGVAQDVEEHLVMAVRRIKGLSA